MAVFNRKGGPAVKVIRGKRYSRYLTVGRGAGVIVNRLRKKGNPAQAVKLPSGYTAIYVRGKSR